MAGFAAENRRRLWMLEDSYYRGRYGYIEYTREEAEECIETARRLIRILYEAESLAEHG